VKTATDIEQEAADWVVTLSDPDCTEAQLAELDAWLAQSDEHERIFQELRGVWNGMDGVGSRATAAQGEAPPSDAGQELLVAPDPEETPIAFQGVIRAYHQRHVSNTEEVYRLVRKTYLRLVAASSSGPPSARSIAELLLVTARDLALEQLRDGGWRSEHLVDIRALERLDVSRQIQLIASTDRILATLTSAFNTLPHRCRDVCILYNLQGRTCVQVAAQLGISQKAVKQRLVQIARHFEAALARY